MNLGISGADRQPGTIEGNSRTGSAQSTCTTASVRNSGCRRPCAGPQATRRHIQPRPSANLWLSQFVATNDAEMRGTTIRRKLRDRQPEFDLYGVKAGSTALNLGTGTTTAKGGTTVFCIADCTGPLAFNGANSVSVATSYSHGRSPLTGDVGLFPAVT